MIEDLPQECKSIAWPSPRTRRSEIQAKKSDTITVSHGADRTLTATLQRWHESARELECANERASCQRCLMTHVSLADHLDVVECFSEKDLAQMPCNRMVCIAILSILSIRCEFGCDKARKIRTPYLISASSHPKKNNNSHMAQTSRSSLLPHEHNNKPHT